jgi:iron complex transport system permease protein
VLTRPRALLFLAFLAALALASLVFGLATGSLVVPPGEVLRSLSGAATGVAAQVVVELRLPRVLAAFACGGLLALAGALMQVLLRNPLADPYVLGVSGGAAVGALAAMLSGLAAALAVPAAAFLGALAAIALVFGLSGGAREGGQARLLLTGVIVAAGCGAAVALMLTIAPEHQLRGMLFWLMGDVGQAEGPYLALLVLAIGLACALWLARDLNQLARGRIVAATLGVDVATLTLILYVLASLLTAVAVTTIGSVGFVGLVVPHLVRLALGNDQRLLLPATVLAGGTLLTVADTLARTLFAPQQLPVGVLTALIGVPVFLYLLARSPGGEPA